MAKILIIDDEQPVRDALEAIGQADGHETRSAPDGRRGLALYLSYQPDLVVTDILMPEKEGIETIAALKSLRPDLPIIAISGGGRVGSLDFLAVAKRLGADRILPKPFPAAALIAAFAEILPPAVRTP